MTEHKIMEGFISLLLLFLFIPAIVFPLSCGGWVLALKLKGRCIRNPFSIIDVITPVVCILLWGWMDTMFLVVHKRMGNLFEIVGLGGVWALLFVIRLLVLFTHSERKTTLVWWGDVGVMILTVISVFVIPIAIE